MQNTFTLGDFQVATILAGTRAVEGPQNIFGMNVSAEEFAAASDGELHPRRQDPVLLHPDRGQHRVRGGAVRHRPERGGTLPALAEAGYAPEDIDVVVLTHMHGDHIGGLMNDGAPTYANARYVTGQVEFDAWAEHRQRRL